MANKELEFKDLDSIISEMRWIKEELNTIEDKIVQLNEIVDNTQDYQLSLTYKYYIRKLESMKQVQIDISYRLKRLYYLKY